MGSQTTGALVLAVVLELVLVVVVLVLELVAVAELVVLELVAVALVLVILVGLVVGASVATSVEVLEGEAVVACALLELEQVSSPLPKGPTPPPKQAPCPSKAVEYH